MNSAPTKQVSKIYVKKGGAIDNSLLSTLINSSIDSKFDSLNNALAKLEKKEFVFSKTKSCVYVTTINAVVPDPREFDFCTYPITDGFRTPKKTYTDFAGFSGTVMSRSEMLAVFYNQTGNQPSEYLKCFLNIDAILYKDKKYQFCFSGDNTKNYGFGDVSIRPSFFGRKEALYCPIAYCDNNKLIGLIFGKGSFIPETLSKSDAEFLKILCEHKNMIHTSGRLSPTKAFYDYAARHSEELGLLPKNNTYHTDLSYLLSSDEIRADIDKYDERILTDINRGHWELWNNNENIDDEFREITTSQPLVARDPAADIKKGGIIAIDFGTKSTVVVCQDGADNPIPMRVGMGRLHKKAEAKHYENPTILEFIDIESFLKDYNTSEGRPQTRWEDVTISHTAMQDMLEDSSTSYNSYFSSLKQWCSEKDFYAIISDKKSKRIQLSPYLSNNSEFDPIELYAYYLGLYINNMYNGIYMNYVMSFPVSFEKQLKEQLLESFTKGLRKSFPQALLDNENAMKQFKVVMDTSEPAAYAACALQEYGLEPEPDDSIFYGVFDFGGGTTDFDFGLWKCSDDDDLRYDYILEHFGAGGDRYLGGENILRMLAYNVFADNIEFCRENNITFIRPPECNRFPGDEIFVRNSQEASMNMRQCMEALRPLWERSEGYEEKYANAEISVQLYSADGTAIPGCRLSIDVDKLQGLIRSRINSGITSFFSSLKNTFTNPHPQVLGKEKINIFLAGNSSLSPVVRELFDEHIAQLEKQISSTNNSCFEIYPPLGSTLAILIQEEKGIRTNDISAPSGKTGVAFGLIACRRGGKIKVISNNSNTSGETKFLYYVGLAKKKKFRVLIDKGEEYGTWHRFLPADFDTFELYYTSLPDASSNTLDIGKTKLIRQQLPLTDENAYIYIRATSPSEIQYTAAYENGIGSEEYLFDPVTVDLSE